MTSDGQREQGGINTGTAAGSIWRKKHIIIIALCVCIGPAIYFNEAYPPIYEATTSILLEPIGESVSSLSFTAAPLNKTFIVNQIQEIKSQSMAEDVLAKLDDSTRDEILAGAGATAKEGPSDTWLTKQVRKSIAADPVRDSDVIRVRVTAKSPAIAARLANTLIDVLGERNLSVKKQEVSSVRQFIEDQLTAVRERLKTSEEELNAFKEKNKVLTLDKESEALLDQMTDVEMQFNEASTERGSLEKELQAIRDEMGRQKGQLGLSVADFTSPWIQELKKNLVDLQVRYTTLQVQGYSEDHPQMKQLAGEIEATRQNLTNEILKFTADDKLVDPLSRMQDLLVQALTLEIKISALQAKEDALKNIKNNYENEIETLPGKELVLARLSRAKQVNEKIYTMLLEKYEEARIAEAGKIGNIRVIDPAKLPQTPIRPRKALNMALAVLIGLSTGSALAIHMGSKDRPLRTLTDIHSVGATPLLGMIPNMNMDGKRNGYYYYYDSGDVEGAEPFIKTDLLLIHGRRSVSGEAYRVLRTNLRYLNGDQPIKTVVFSSPSPNEGKTTTVVNLALAMAEAEMKTLILESDLRKPTIHEIFGVDGEPGLTNFLVGESGIKDIVRPTAHRNLWVVPVGLRVNQPSELLGSPIMAHLIGSLREEYDAVLMDSPPIMPVTDGAVLARQADGVVMVVRSGVTTMDSYLAARQLFENVKAPVVGTVLNYVTPSSVCGGKRRYSYYSYYGGNGDKKRANKNRTPEKSRQNVST
jgi:succinoglycan biosynthesis transport protein ExoP